MAFILIEFKCTKCETQQEQLVTNADKAEDPCKNCSAKPEKLKPTIGLSRHRKHVSWSKWSV